MDPSTSWNDGVHGKLGMDPSTHGVHRRFGMDPSTHGVHGRFKMDPSTHGDSILGSM